MDYDTARDSAPFKINEEATDAKVGDAVTIKVVVTYYEVGEATPSTAEKTITTTFK